MSHYRAFNEISILFNHKWGKQGDIKFFVGSKLPGTLSNTKLSLKSDPLKYVFICKPINICVPVSVHRSKQYLMLYVAFVNENKV